MLSGPFFSRQWMGTTETFEEANVIMLGVGFDGTCCNIPGSRFAPETLRLASWAIEDYSPRFDKHLDDVKFFDMGDLELSPANVVWTMNVIEQNVREIYAAEKKYIGIGGEHSVSFPAIKACYEKYPDLKVIHFDAHTDLRKEYLEEKYSHAAVMYHVGELIGFENLKQIGIRSGTKEEFEIMKKFNTRISSPKELKVLKGENIFVSVDVDVLCTSVMPGTGTQEAGGFMFNELMSWFEQLADLNIVGADVVELAPNIDKTGASTAVCAKIIRELLMTM